MSNDVRYEQSLIAFQKKRQDLLDSLVKVTPQASELHRRRWRLHQLDNALGDIKETVAACNMQLEEEKNNLEQFTSETDRLKAMNNKLSEDVKILEGVTGMKAHMPDDIEDETYNKIIDYSTKFRENFSTFYENLPQIKQELPIDPLIDKNSKILIETLHDCIEVTFDSRAESAFLTKEATEKTEKMKQLEKELRVKELKLKNEVDNQKKKIEESTRRMVETIEEQGKELRKEARKIEEEYIIEHNELRKNIDSLISQETNLKYRCNSINTYNKALKENMKRRILELELELDRFQKRIDLIRKNQNIVDKRLVNMSLLLSRKSALLDQAILEMRNEIASFDLWLNQRSSSTQ